MNQNQLNQSQQEATKSQLRSIGSKMTLKYRMIVKQYPKTFSLLDGREIFSLLDGKA